MKGMTPRNDKEREFMKTFDDLCYSRTRWQVWDDFVHMAALSIVNAVDKKHFDAREERFMRIRKPYKEKEFNGFAHLFSITALALEENPWQDFLGELYMRCDLGNNDSGQFFTPYHICEMMAKIILAGEDGAKTKAEIEGKGYVSVCDPCIGGGAMLIGAAQALHEMGINYQQECVFVGQDVDSTVAMMAYIQLSLLGCPGYIKIGDSLRYPMTGNVLFGDGEEHTYYTPMFLTEKFEFLRRAEILKQLFYSVGTAEKPQTDANNHQPKAAMQQLEPVVQQPEPVVRQLKAPDDGPQFIEISKKKGKAMAGQIMFDLGI